MTTETRPTRRPPPGVASAIEILHGHGHTVTVRETAAGSFRYSVDGRPETDAHTMIRRFAGYGL